MTTQTERSKRWYEQNKDLANERSKEWYEQHKEEQNARRRAAYQELKADPVKWAEYQENERERGKHKRANWTPEQKATRNEQCKVSQKKHPEAGRRAALKSHRKARNECLAAYGSKCACCGESTPEFLAIDHINGGGNAHRRSLGKRDIYFWLRAEGYPTEFQILCHNCNHAKGSYGICPHERLRGSDVGPVIQGGVPN